jgi:hypothetical protein
LTASNVPESTQTAQFAEPLHFDSQAALLASLLGYRRGGGPAEESDLTPDEWRVWAAGLVAADVRAGGRVPFPRCPKSQAVARTGALFSAQWDANRAHVLGCRWRRKARVMALGMMAVGWADADDAAWGPLAEQWRDRFLSLPGGDPSSSPQYDALTREVGALHLCRRRTKARRAKARRSDEIDD